MQRVAAQHLKKWIKNDQRKPLEMRELGRLGNQPWFACLPKKTS